MADHVDHFLQPQDSLTNALTEEVLQTRAETPSVEVTPPDNANSQLPEVGRNLGWCMADLGSF